MNRDLALGGATLSAAAAYYAMASAIPESLLSDSVGPQGLPKTYAVLLAALSVILIVRSLTARGAAPSGPETAAGPETDRPAFGRVAGMLTIGAAYLLVVPWLGYAPSLGALIAGTVYYQGGVLNRRVAAVAALGAAGLWLLFVRLLQIPHPPGVWPSLF